MLVASWWAVILIGVLGFKLVHDTDIFWQVRLGQIMLEEGRIPQFDRFTYTHAGEPAPPIGWLAQVLFAALYGLGGWHLTRAVHQLALVGSLLVAAATCRRDPTSPFSVLVAMTIAFLVMLSNADLRPQSFGLLGFATLGIGTRPAAVRDQAGRGAAAPGHLAKHASIGGGGRGRVGRIGRGRFLRPKNGTGASPWQLVVLALLGMVLQFATPLGGRIFDVSRSICESAATFCAIAEWLPPWDPSRCFRGGRPLLGGAFAVSLIAIVWFWDRLSCEDRALFFVMTVLSLYAARFIIFWAVALVPLWAEVVERLIPRGMFAWARGRGGSGGSGRSVVAGTGGGSGHRRSVSIRRGSGRSSVPRFRSTVSGPFALELPGAARIYNHYGWAGPLILEGLAGWRVAVDGRLYFFSDPAEWQSIEDARAGRIPLDELERRHRPDAFFLYPGGNRALVEALSTCPRWRACFSGPTCVAFVRSR